LSIDKLRVKDFVIRISKFRQFSFENRPLLQIPLVDCCRLAAGEKNKLVLAGVTGSIGEQDSRIRLPCFIVLEKLSLGIKLLPFIV
jgi:hypothetical protein